MIIYVKCIKVTKCIRYDKLNNQCVYGKIENNIIIKRLKIKQIFEVIFS